MILPYRTRCALRRLLFVLLALAVLAFVVWGCWMIWLSRYVVYTRDGVKLDFSLPEKVPTGQTAKPTEPEDKIQVNYSDDVAGGSTPLTQLKGYYADINALTAGIPAVKAQIQALPAGTPVMVDVKSISGRFFYSSGVSDVRSETINTQEMDDLIDYLDQSGMYTIARLPALRDFYYGLNHVSDGLPIEGGYLWPDEQGCYWLNPNSGGTLTYLAQIVNELKALGFDEVVFYDFCFPNTNEIIFKQDKTEALSNAAKTLVSSCATDRFAISFVSSAVFQVPEGRCRLYIQNAEPSNAANLAQQTGLADPTIRVVFLTELHDTRFDDYSVLRPLSAAH